MTNVNETPGLTKSDITAIGARKKVSDRLIAKCSYDHLTGCLEYKGNNDHCGYGKIKINGRQLGAHRVAYVEFVGDVPPGMVVMHTCDNPCCINVSHLVLGTQKDNMVDSVNKGRHPGLISKNALPHKNRGKYFKPICVYNDNISIIYKNPVIAIMDGFNSGGIYSALNGDKKTVKGFKAYYL